MSTSPNINELAAALAKAQGQIKGAIKDSINPFFKVNYADLSSVWESCRAPLSVNGLAVTQVLDETESGLMLTTTLMHASGQWIASNVRVVPIKQDPQGLGSAITYMRRYSLAALVGVAPEDDDANAATGKPAQHEQRKATPEPEKPAKVAPAPVTAQPPSAVQVRTEAIAALKESIASAKTALADLDARGMSTDAATVRGVMSDHDRAINNKVKPPTIDQINAARDAIDNAVSASIKSANEKEQDN